jgi:hypothetical protein
MSAHRSPPQFRLRIVEGALEGATYQLRDSFVLGRSGVCDLVLLDRRVSRLHARVGRDPEGAHVLHDLGSANGTRVNGRYTRYHHLEPGDEIAIGDCRFVYEVASSVPLPRPRRPAPDASDARQARTYDGDLLGDVIAHRSLAAALVRGERLDAQALRRFRALDEALRDPADPTEFQEFSLSMRARVRSAWLGNGSDTEVVLTSLGVGSATLLAPAVRYELQDVLHLVLDPAEIGVADKIAFNGIVVAMAPGRYRLAFSMSAGWAARMASLQHAPTEHFQRVGQSMAVMGVCGPAGATRSKGADPR